MNLFRTRLLSFAAFAPLMATDDAAAGGGGDGAADTDANANADPSLLGDASADAGQGAGDGKEGEGAQGQDQDDKSKDDADGGKEGEGEKAQADATPFEGLKAPEGFEALDADLLTMATPLMRAQGIDTPEKAQAFVDSFAPVLGAAVEKAVTADRETAQAAITEEVRGWVEQSRSDKDFGGAKFQENMAHAARFRDRFVTTEAGKALLREAPIFNHPEVVRMFVAAGKALGEDTVHQSDHSAQVAPKDMGEALYGDMKPVGPA